MFFPLTQQDYAMDDDGVLQPYQRRIMVPYSCVKIIEELQDDDADSDRVRMFGWGARTLIDIGSEFIYVVETIETINGLVR